MPDPRREKDTYTETQIDRNTDIQKHRLTETQTLFTRHSPALIIQPTAVRSESELDQAEHLGKALLVL